MIIGGEPIGSGSYGCVFRPALRCFSKEAAGLQRSNKTISKLMKKKYALEEYNEITAIKRRLKTIPNYQNYFLLKNITYCEPQELNNEDLKDFDNKCKNSRDGDDDFIANNINDSLNEYYILNMPYGGQTIKQYFSSIHDENQYVNLNNHLLKLLVYGILPMNKKKVYHCDIKENNVLVQVKAKQNTVKYLHLIDWGLSVIVKNWNAIPKNWRNRPLQFNSPFSVILFFPSFIDQYNVAIQKPKNNARQLVTEFFNFLLGKWPGHFDTISYFYNEITGHDDNNKKDIKDVIIDSLELVLEKYADPITKEFLVMKYITEVYIYIVDIYGFISIYVSILDILQTKMKNGTISRPETLLLHYLQKFLSKHFIQQPQTKYNLPELIKEIKYINSFFKRNEIIVPSPKSYKTFEAKTLESVPNHESASFIFSSKTKFTGKKRKNKQNRYKRTKKYRKQYDNF